ncbi:hypothetical protein GCM10009601_02280 [Streptomyces thermospinosisporus]|uniref:Uncharacterized protein n=1 Tax=Streptomyces thermospinosisporus TaxID=161482 RepID=A0ABN1YI44_9ACTN
MTTAIAPLSSKTGRAHLQESLCSWLAPEDAPPAPETKTVEEPTPEPDSPAEAPADEAKPDLSHVWVVAAEIEVAPKVAKVADYRGSFKATEGLRIDALEVYCKGCRRPYDEVTGQDCAAKIDNRHLIGGDQSTRAKRKIPVPPRNARVVPGGRIQRRGIEAYVGGVSRPPR